VAAEFDIPTDAFEIPVLEQNGAPIEQNILAFRAANLRVIALILGGADPRGKEVIDANREADEAFAGHGIIY
jgi:hypothetical protein